MNVVKKNGNIQVSVKNFNLAQSLDCGQSFRFTEKDGIWQGIAFGRVLKVKQEKDTLLFYGCNTVQAKHWIHYLDLERDYESIKMLLCRDTTLKKACEYAGGIHILQQQPWEALCSFIISQNNNIPRIKGIVSRLCENFGRQIAPGLFAFPSAEELACLQEEDLACIRTGFRNRYILDAARKIATGVINLEEMRDMESALAREQLMQITGVGPKVADCVLLYGLGHIDICPVDVWMRRILEQYYPNGLPTYAKPFAGIAQQYLFHYARTCLDENQGKQAG